MGIGMIADFVARVRHLARDLRQRRTLWPHMKNVARTCCSARISSSAGVDSLGPSSKVERQGAFRAVAMIDGGREDAGASATHGVRHGSRGRGQDSRGRADERTVRHRHHDTAEA